MYLKPLNCTPEMVTVVNFLLGIFYLRLKEESHDKPRQCFKKQRHHFANKGPYNQSYGFSHLVMYGCEIWTIKDEHLRIDAFELWCWRRLLTVPWTVR